ncbi:MAG TPA: MoaD/ThiS family protein [Miltoncostaeaceae bacterium]|nr:MoaD/ThiS family protein [Miltoncostaeaceae bacterium]
MSDASVRIEVLLFAALAERVGRRRVPLALPADARVSDVWSALAVPGPAPAALRHAVNAAWVDADHALRDGDTVALITPVSGG